MLQYDGPNALDNMGVITKPIGTLDEIKAAGYDPGKTASCSPPGTRGVMPCDQWQNCVFNRKSMGGFKGEGPKYVAYRLITDEGTANENCVKCHSFMRHLYSRMIHGQKQKLDGKRGEIIRIIGQEGDFYRPRVAVKKDPENKRADAEWVYKTDPVEVPRHPRPGEVSPDDYVANLVKAEMQEADRQRILDDIANEQAAKMPPLEESTFEDQIRPKRGRPRGSKNKVKGEPDVGQTAHAEPD